MPGRFSLCWAVWAKSFLCVPACAQEVVMVAALGVLAVPGLRLWPEREVRYARTPRRWLGLRGGRLVQVAQPEPWHSPPGDG